MMNLLPCLVILFLLAGCSEAPSAPIAQPLQNQPAPLAARIKEWDGTLTGAGAVLPDGSVRFYGTFTTPEGFAVEDTDARLTVEMTWDHAVPQPFFVNLISEEAGSRRIESRSPYDGTAGVTLHLDNPARGPWSAIGLVNGVAVDATYHIRVILEQEGWPR